MVVTGGVDAGPGDGLAASGSAGVVVVIGVVALVGVVFVFASWASAVTTTAANEAAMSVRTDFMTPSYMQARLAIPCRTPPGAQSLTLNVLRYTRFIARTARLAPRASKPASPAIGTGLAVRGSWRPRVPSFMFMLP